MKRQLWMLFTIFSILHFNHLTYSESVMMPNPIVVIPTQRVMVPQLNIEIADDTTGDGSCPDNNGDGECDPPPED